MVTGTKTELGKVYYVFPEGANLRDEWVNKDMCSFSQLTPLCERVSVWQSSEKLSNGAAWLDRRALSATHHFQFILLFFS